MNINDLAKVKLTKKGEEIWFKDIWSTCSGYDKTTKFLILPIWNLMEVFGQYMYMGCTPLFEHGQIDFMIYKF